MNTQNLQESLKYIISILKNICIKDKLFVDQIYYINLEKRIDRRENIENQIKTFFDATLENTTRIPGVVANSNSKIDGAMGCTMAHLNVITDAIKNNYKRIMVLEDDFEFICNETKFYKDIHQFLETYDNFDIFLLAFGDHKSQKITDLLEIVHKSLSTSGYIISNKAFQSLQNVCNDSIRILKETKSVPKGAIDVVWENIMKSRQNTYKFNYRVGKQLASYSDIEKRHVNYGV